MELLSRNLMVATGTAFLNVTANGTWGALLPLHYRRLGATDAEIGLAFTLTLLAQTLLQVFGGLLADRIGRRVILFAMSFNALLYITAGLSGDWRVVMLAIAGTRMLMGAQWPAMFPLISESVPKAAQGRAFALFEFAIGLGATIGPALGALLIEHFHAALGALIVANGVIFGATAITRGLLMREGPRARAATARNVRSAFSRDLLWYIASLSLYTVVETLTLFGPFFALFTHDNWQADEAAINLLTSAGSFSAIIIGLWGGHWADRAGGRRVIIFSSFGLTAALAGIALSPSLLVGFVPVLLAFIFVQFLIVAQSALMSHMTTLESRSTMVGIMGTAQSLSGSGGPLLGAAVIPLLGPAAPFALGAAVCALSAWAMSRVRQPVVTTSIVRGND
jgi:MFS family permease